MEHAVGTALLKNASIEITNLDTFHVTSPFTSLQSH